MKSLVTIFLTVLVLASCCPAQSDPPPYEEVHAKIRHLSDQQLINCLSEKHASCPLEDSYRDSGLISAELGDRKHSDELIAAYESGDQLQRYYIVQSLWQIHNRKVLAFMRSIAFENLPPGQDRDEVFFPLDYLAQHCDQRALARLSRKVNFDKSFPVGCILWAPTVEAFARCNYRPSSPSLVLALNAACLNITDAAMKGLSKFFPNACEQASSIDELEHCYTKLLQENSAGPR
jgi:hypothetical protein